MCAKCSMVRLSSATTATAAAAQTAAEVSRASAASVVSARKTAIRGALTLPRSIRNAEMSSRPRLARQEDPSTPVMPSHRSRISGLLDQLVTIFVLGEAGRLEGEQLRIAAAAGEQLVVGARLQHPA